MRPQAPLRTPSLILFSVAGVACTCHCGVNHSISQFSKVLRYLLPWYKLIYSLFYYYVISSLLVPYVASRFPVFFLSLIKKQRSTDGTLLRATFSSTSIYFLGFCPLFNYFFLNLCFLAIYLSVIPPSLNIEYISEPKLKHIRICIGTDIHCLYQHTICSRFKIINYIIFAS